MKDEETVDHSRSHRVCLVILGAIWFILGNPEETGEEDQKAETSVWKGKERIQEIRVESRTRG